MDGMRDSLQVKIGLVDETDLSRMATMAFGCFLCLHAQAFLSQKLVENVP